VIELDVRELVPPEPMMKILENINRVDEKTILLVHHHREPLMLYPKLEERGYEAVTNKISENYYKVVIKKKGSR
jgi:TusA-related sulfurtransferase